jgi:hypothetical protein
VAASVTHHGPDPELTTGDVRRAVRDLLPGARVRRLLLWRYLLTWRKRREHRPPSVH